MSPKSLAERLADLPQAARDAYIDSLSEEEAHALLYDWEFHARPSQLPPSGDWRGWLLLAGRGFGKTRTGAEWVRRQKEISGRIALVAPTAADVRDVIVEGSSGLLAIAPPWDRPRYEPSKRRLTWNNGAVAYCYSADEPDRLRGPQHDAAWCDELAAWRYPESWDMLMMGLRLGQNPRVVVTTTPRPIKLIHHLLADPGFVVTRGTTWENAANLARPFLQQIVRRYQGTRLGRQELDAELLEDAAGALWQRGMIEAARVAAAPPLIRVVVAIDPAVTSGENSDETGIVAAGIAEDGHAYVLEDCSLRASPDGWARRALQAAREWGADRIVAEVNNGGDLVETTLRMVDRNAPYKPVRATRGKGRRAEPIAALYEQRRVHHVGQFPQLEDQLCLLTPDFSTRTAGFSPDRADAAVWALSELTLGPSTTGLLEYYAELNQRMG